MGTRFAGRVLVVTAVVAATALMPGPAVAHNALVSSEPVDGASLQRAPDEVQLTFLSTLDPADARLIVVGPDGESMIEGKPEFDGASALIPLRPGPAGDYAVEYEVRSDDGHLVTGRLRFTVTVGEEVSPPPSREPRVEPDLAPETVAPTGSPAVTSQVAGDSRSWWPWWVLAGLLVAAAAGGLWRRLRRQSR